MTKILFLSKKSGSNCLLTIRLQKELLADIYECNTSAEAIGLLRLINFRFLISDLEEDGGDILDIFEVIENDEKSEVTLIALDSSCRLLEADKEKVIVIENANPIEELVEQLRFMGAESRLI